jgi:hypothetical protein
MDDIPKSLSDFTLLWRQDPAEMLGSAYADGLEMLSTASNQRKALFMVLD